jgi:hypothetical protein
MPRELKISAGQHSDKGRKDINQDFHGVLIPKEPLLSLKGVAVVLADGISSSQVSQVASESAVKGFLTDYYCTSEAWSVKTSAQRVIAATNSWLHAQTRRSRYAYDQDRGYVCTLSAMVVKAKAAHIFHVGDSRIYRVTGNTLEQLTDDHRVVLSSEQSYLGRALGVNPQIEIDYRCSRSRRGCVCAGGRRRRPCRAALYGDAIRMALGTWMRLANDRRGLSARAGNLTMQIVRIDELPDGQAGELFGQASKPLPPLLKPGRIDGYKIIGRCMAAVAVTSIWQLIRGDTLVIIRSVDRAAWRSNILGCL